MAHIYQPTAYRARRAYQRRNAYSAARFWTDFAAIVGTVALIAALCLLAYGLQVERVARVAEPTPRVATYALVMVYNGADTWREVLAAGDLTFSACDKVARQVWARDSGTVATVDGDAMPRVDAYCVDMRDLPSDVER